MIINSSLMTLFVKMLTVFKSPLLKVSLLKVRNKLLTTLISPNKP